MFQGPSQLVLDGKGRLVIPTRHRAALNNECEGKLTLTLHPHGCLLMYGRPQWEAFREKVLRLPLGAMDWQRIFLGNATDVEMDGAGRVLISPELIRAGRLEKERPVMLLGMGPHFEIWEATAHDQRQATTLSGDVPAVLANFTL